MISMWLLLSGGAYGAEPEPAVAESGSAAEAPRALRLDAPAEAPDIAAPAVVPLWLRAAEPPVLAPSLELEMPGPTPAAPSPHAAQSPGEPTLRRVAERLGREAAAIRALWSVENLMRIAVLVALGMSAYGALGGLSRWVRATGYVAERRLIGARGILTTGAALWVGGCVARDLLERAPLAGTALVGLVVGGVGLLLASRAVTAVGSLGVILGARIREGDRLTVGDVSGVVEHAGSFRIRVRQADGSTAYVSLRDLGRETIVVSSPRRAQVVRIRFGGPTAFTPEELEAVARAAALCPYRRPGTEVKVERTDDDRSLEVTIEAWSASAAAAAERWLRQPHPGPPRSARGDSAAG